MPVPETRARRIAGGISVDLVPHGTLVERVRKGGLLTPKGLGTPVEAVKGIVEVAGTRYLLEMPIRGDFTLIGARQAV